MEKRKLFKLKQGEEVYFIIIDNKNFKVRKAKVDYVSSYSYIYVSYEKETYGFKIENKNSVSSINRNSNLTYILGTDFSTVMKETKDLLKFFKLELKSLKYSLKNLPNMIINKEREIETIKKFKSYCEEIYG